jgi:hypothetical protein
MAALHCYSLLFCPIRPVASWVPALARTTVEGGTHSVAFLSVILRESGGSGWACATQASEAANDPPVEPEDDEVLDQRWPSFEARAFSFPVRPSAVHGLLALAPQDEGWGDRHSRAPR